MNNLNLVLPSDPSVPAEFLVTLNDRMRQIQSAIKALSVPASPTGTCLQGNHANRVTRNAANLAPGTQFWENDRFSLYVVEELGKTGTWAWAAGFYSDIMANQPQDLGQADQGFVFFATDKVALYIWSGRMWQGYTATATTGTFAARPTGLTRANTGLLYYCSTGTGGVAYNHTFRWTGTAWEPGPGESLGGYFRDYAIVPIEPGWQICDGTATHFLDIVAGALVEVSFATPNLTGAGGAYRKSSASYTGAINTAALITLTGNTDDTTAGTPAGGISMGIPTADTTVQAGTGASVASSLHAHSASLVGTAMPVHHHGLTGATATLATDPIQNMGVFPYFRR